MNGNEQGATGAAVAIPENEVARCDAGVSIWDPWLSRLYFDTLCALSRMQFN